MGRDPGPSPLPTPHPVSAFRAFSLAPSMLTGHYKFILQIGSHTMIQRVMNKHQYLYSQQIRNIL